MIYTQKDKDNLIEKLKLSLGVVTTACLSTGISRETYYTWLREDPEFAKKVEGLKDVAIDFVESSLYSQIKKGVPASTIFFLKTRGRSRGYVERTESINLNMQLGGKDISEYSQQDLEDEYNRLMKATGMKQLDDRNGTQESD